MKYDLEERTAGFGERIIDFAKKVKKDNVFLSIVIQSVRSGTSIGANYSEANQASSKRDFRNKIYICKKEANETKYWLRMLAKTFPDKKLECRILWKEAHELTLIFSKILSSSKKTINNKISNL
ncbi:four helix bundle protein [Patescibacteria group bacterium]|nr:four helix bundle protein [Patescibacteria group bacterium]MCL5797574.1 four helix bundle protein [Patescibacteria group bacterium]